jgi:hypothetical protein
VKVTATPTSRTAQSAGRLARHIREELLSSNTVARLRRELEDELEAVSSSERAADEAEARRDALERAVRRVWGAPL